MGHLSLRIAGSCYEQVRARYIPVTYHIATVLDHMRKTTQAFNQPNNLTSMDI